MYYNNITREIRPVPYYYHFQKHDKSLHGIKYHLVGILIIFP